MCSLKTCDDFVRTFKKYTEEYHIVVFSIEGFDNLSVQDIIDELEQQLKENCKNIIKGIRLTSKNCFVTVSNSEQCQILVNAGLKIKDKPITLHNIWEKSTILHLSAVPPHVPDEQVIAVISCFADVIGNIEKEIYKGYDTGERFIHVKSPETIPGQIFLGSTCLNLNIIYPRSNSNIDRRKSFRSQININLKPLEENETNSPKYEDQVTPVSESQPNEPSFFAKSTGITLTTPEMEKIDIFQFPVNPITLSQQNQNSIKKKQKSNSNAKETKSVAESPSSFRKFSQRRNNSRKNPDASQPPSPIPFQGTPKGMRKTSVNFRGSMRGPEMYSENGIGYMRERSASDTSSRQSICRRKLSITGHEGSGKIPWCGCWGIGCC